MTADAVIAEAGCEDPIVLVQDYHFALVPRMLRRRCPRATILTFFHIPWPNAERFGICPWREELITGMLGSSILGFHTQQHCNNFLECVETRKHPVSDIEQGYMSTAACILANISMQLGRSIQWDHAAGKVVGDEEANRLLRRPYRAPWTHPDPKAV